jgi:tRNA (cmo5U34)-methyltransferase
MSFENTTWKDKENVKEYLETADYFIPERRTILAVLASFYESFLIDCRRKRILDLGTGDGILVRTLYEKDKNAEFIVTDGSDDMLQEAKEKLKGIPVSQFIKITFEEIINGKFKERKFDFIVSSFAIHHLTIDLKKKLFESLYDFLIDGGYFINIDATTHANEKITKWYYKIWREWIINFRNRYDIKEKHEEVIEKALKKPENHYDPLEIQLKFLREIGYKDVDCHYKFGVFTIYGGQK